jgi:uncharacterized small protein (DUF1192 family)
MYNQSATDTTIAVDVSFGSDSWFGNHEMNRGYIVEELDDIWEDQESSTPELGFFETKIFAPDHSDENTSMNMDTQQAPVSTADLVDNILKILLSNNPSDATIRTADVYNNRSAIESVVKLALGKFCEDKSVDQRKDEAHEKRKEIPIDDLVESELDQEIQQLEEEIARLKAKKRLLQRNSQCSALRSEDGNSNFPSDNSPDHSEHSSPLSMPISPSQCAPVSSSHNLPPTTSQRCYCTNCTIGSGERSHFKKDILSSPTRKRTPVLAAGADVDTNMTSPNDKRKRRKSSKTTSSTSTSSVDIQLQFTFTEHANESEFRSRTSTKSKKKVVKKPEQVFKTEQVLKLKKLEVGGIEEDVDILN